MSKKDKAPESTIRYLMDEFTQKNQGQQITITRTQKDWRVDIHMTTEQQWIRTNHYDPIIALDMAVERFHNVRENRRRQKRGGC